LQKEGYVVDVDRTITNSPDVPKDRVVGTDPPMDTPGQRGDSVKLLVSSGQTEVPDCAGKTQQECSDLLAEAGLRLGGTTTEESDQEPGTVLRQDPIAKTTVDQNSPVTVVVAQLPTTVTVPETDGMDQATAEKALRDEGFVVNVQTVASPTVPVGFAVRTVPGAGAPAARDSVVILEISSGPATGTGG
jgi:serine/threonine-protein kinase